jgi:peroxiredoxin
MASRRWVGRAAGPTSAAQNFAKDFSILGGDQDVVDRVSSAGLLEEKGFPMSKSGRACGAFFILVMLLALPCAAAGDSGVCNVPRRAANLGFTLTDPRGHEVRLSDYKGQVILLNFWATWCQPCKTEIPWLNELYGTYRKQGFIVLGISMDGEAARVQPFAAALHMDYPLLLGAGADDFLESFAPLLGFPTSLLISRDGVICVRHTGIVNQQELEHSIRGLL